MLPSCPTQNWRHLQEEMEREALRPRRRTVLLVDGDRTLTPFDTSRIFLDRAGLPLAPIKESFQQHGYSYPGFLFHASVYLQVQEPRFSRLCRDVADSVPLFAGAAEFLRRAVQRADVYVVTAGVSPIWSYLLERERLSSVQVLGGIFHGARFLIGRDEKGRICQHLRAQGSPRGAARGQGTFLLSLPLRRIAVPLATIDLVRIAVAGGGQQRPATGVAAGRRGTHGHSHLSS